MKPPTMNENRVSELILAFGANENRWPATERQNAQAWLAENLDTHESLNELLSHARDFDQMLDMGACSDNEVKDTTLLHARILKAASKTAQDIPDNTEFMLQVANDGPDDADKFAFLSASLASWRSVAATLLLTTGIGFGIGQMATADTSYASAEALLSVSMQSGYEEADLGGDEL